VPQKLQSILSHLGGGFSAALKNCELLSLWPQVVDDRVGKNTEPVKIKNRTLYVAAASPAWAQELSFLKREIINKFNLMAGEEVISDIRFKSAEGV